MTRRKQNCPKRMKWEGSEGEEPPEDVCEEDGENDDEEEEGADEGDDNEEYSVVEADHYSSPAPAEPEERPSSSGLAVEQPGLATATTPVPISEDEASLLEHTAADRSVDGSSQKESISSITPPPPVLERCSSRESSNSADDDSIHTYSSVPPKLTSMPPDKLSSPPLLLPVTTPPLKSPMMEVDDGAVLDFSTKKQPPTTRSPSPVLNLSNKPSIDEPPLNGPLDLSLGSSRKREYEDPIPSVAKKAPRIPVSPLSPWSTPLLTYQLPYFSAAAAAAAAAAAVTMPAHHQFSARVNSGVDTSLWNGKGKLDEKSVYGIPLHPTDASRALEKMSELSKLSSEEFRPMVPPSISGTSGRHNAWQSHWLNKGAEQAKDVLKCVWCKQSFPTLAAMTSHMQEAKHCNVNVPPPPQQSSSLSPHQPHHSNSSSSLNSPSAANSKSGSSDLNTLIKETMPLPRKLVRGQDVWLGKGAEQTRQILKCMWCGQSFRSLAEMTSHMQQTQHYTNIISQEQIISWKSAEEGKSNNSSNNGNSSGSGVAGSGSTNSHVTAVLTCKVCDQAFSSLKELSNHMVKNSHYKEHIMRSITESGGRRRQTREKRKKSLPVRKLLELERAQNELKNGGDNMMMNMMMMGKSGGVGSGHRITCEKCGEKVDMSVFVEHIRICVGASTLGEEDKKDLLKNALLSSYGGTSRNFRKHGKDASLSNDTAKQEGKSGSPSVLNAIEKLIEKSFDPRSRHGIPGYPVGTNSSNTSGTSSILKRLGIDESVDYTKPLMDASLQAAKVYMSYHAEQQQQGFFAGSSGRERSGSESSSLSERGSRHESLTPDRKCDQSMAASTPRTTPEKRTCTPPLSSRTSSRTYDSPEREFDTKGELKEEEKGHEQEEEGKRRRRYSREASATPNSIVAQCDEKEASGAEDMSSNIKRSRRHVSSPALSPGHSASPSTVGSPSNSERSITPRSSGEGKKSVGSLGALSSMFDNLSGVTSASESGQSKTSSHPLAALQKLCDKTDTHHRSGGGSSHSRNSSVNTNHSPSPQSSNPGAILAFSWACSDAVVTDSVTKCAFCDTPFISKGAYRHHLSKMHFVKDGLIPDTAASSKSPNSASTSALSLAKLSTTNNNSSNALDNNKSVAPTSNQASVRSPQSVEETPHSKFLKYTELAKQLSSKYV